MLSREECISKLKASRPELSRLFSVSSMSLFGSFARNEQTNLSDVDVLVDMKPNLLLQVGLKQYLEQKLGCSVDVVRLHSGMDEFFLKQINNDRVVIFS